MVTHNYKMRKDGPLRGAQRATTDTPGRGRLVLTALSRFGILKVEWGGRKKGVRKEYKSRYNTLVAALCKVGL